MVLVSPYDVAKEMVTVIVVLGILGLVLVAPLALLVAVALGPVVVGVLCAVGFGLIVFALVNLTLGLGYSVRALGRAGKRHAHHAP